MTIASTHTHSVFRFHFSPIFMKNSFKISESEISINIVCYIGCKE